MFVVGVCVCVYACVWFMCACVCMHVCVGAFMYVCMCVCVCVCGSDKLPAAILIRMGPNLDTTCISKMSRGTFLEFSKF